MPLLVTSAAGANGNGYGTLLAFDLNGRSLGAFSGDSRIADPPVRPDGCIARGPACRMVYRFLFRA
jgi:hypothetical protein